MPTQRALRNSVLGRFLNYSAALVYSPQNRLQHSCGNNIGPTSLRIIYQHNVMRRMRFDEFEAQGKL